MFECLDVCIYTTHVPSVCGAHNRLLDPLELDLEIMLNQQEGAVIWTWVPARASHAPNHWATSPAPLLTVSDCFTKSSWFYEASLFPQMIFTVLCCLSPDYHITLWEAKLNSSWRFGSCPSAGYRESLSMSTEAATKPSVFYCQYPMSELRHNLCKAWY